MATLYRYPPSKENPGKVSEGTARDMQNRAEAHHKGTQREAIHKIGSMGDHVEQTNTQRNARRRQRQRRACK